MTEYQFCGVVFFTPIIITLLVATVKVAIDEHKHKKQVKECRRALRIATETQEYATFVAIASNYMA